MITSSQFNRHNRIAKFRIVSVGSISPVSNLGLEGIVFPYATPVFIQPIDKIRPIASLVYLKDTIFDDVVLHNDDTIEVIEEDASYLFVEYSNYLEKSKEEK